MNMHQLGAPSANLGVEQVQIVLPMVARPAERGDEEPPVFAAIAAVTVPLDLVPAR